MRDAADPRVAEFVQAGEETRRRIAEKFGDEKGDLARHVDRDRETSRMRADMNKLAKEVSRG